MRPIQLTLKNLGPYQNQTINFKRLDPAQMFLITGPTGSGKTTIFDAITFALYGQGANDDREIESMRSDFANPDAPTEVDFTFMHQRKTYRIIRRPKQILNKKRGHGQKEYGSEGQLDIYQAHQKLAEIKRLREINLKIAAVLQITREQFVQVILLPQGDFQHFLLAPSSEKEKVLRKIFKTGRYQRWADGLSMMRKQNNHQYQAWQTDIQKALDHVQWADQTLVSEHNRHQAIQKLQQQQHAAHQKLTQMQTTEQRLRQILTRAQQKLTQAQHINQQLDDIEQQKQQLTDLQQHANKYQQLALKIKQLQWTQQLKPDYDQSVALKTQLAADQQHLLIATEQLTTNQKQQQTVLDVHTQLLQQHYVQIARQNEQAILTKVRPLFVEAANATKKLQTARIVVQDKQNAWQQSQQRLVDLQAQDQKLQLELKQLPAIQAQIYQLKQAITQLQQDLQHANAIMKLQTQVKQLTLQIKTNQKQSTQLQEVIKKAHNQIEVLHNQELQNQIVKLVRQLKPGTPCPICGSRKHPMPAHIESIPAVSVETIKVAKQKLVDDQKHQTKLATKIKTDQSQCQQLQHQLHTTTDDLQNKLRQHGFKHLTHDVDHMQTRLHDEVKHTQQQLIQAEDQLKRLTDHQTTHEKQHPLISNLQTKTDQLRMELQTSQNEVQKAQAQLQAITDQLPADFKDKQALDAHLTTLNQEIKKYTQDIDDNQTQLRTIEKQIAGLVATQKSLKRQIKTTQVARQKHLSVLDQAIVKHKNIKQRDELRPLFKQLEQLPTDQQALQAYQTQVQTLQTEIKAQVCTIGGQQKIDLTQDQGQVKQAQQNLTKFIKNYDQQKQQTILNDAALTQIQQALQNIRQHAEQMHQLDALVTTVTGNNDAKLSLERYVLRAELIQILDHANLHLSQLSSGRYAFTLHGATGSYQKDTGLEVDVYDDDVGKRRSVHTLSGGEQFMASLSLALALGEVIQEESGEIHIDTLFIDEGFGSLDRHSLDVAMNTLDQLNDQHRMLGIISHVESLKHRLSYQIQVQKQPDGTSRARIVTPEAGNVKR